MNLLQILLLIQREVQLYHEKRLLERVNFRLNRVDKFIEYLEKQEIKEFVDLGLGDNEIKFAKKLRNHFDIQKKQIIKSAEKNSFYDEAQTKDFPFEED